MTIAPPPPPPPAAGDVLVTAHGAKCDGKTDDAGAITAAVAAAKAKGVYALLPAATCAYGRVLTLDGAKLKGQGDASVLASLNTRATAIFMRGDGAEVRSLKMAGVFGPGREAPWEMTRITLFGAKNFVIDNVTIEGSTAAGIQTAQGTNNGRITNNRINGTLADSIHMTDKASYITVEGNTITSSGDDGIAVVSYRNNGALSHHITARNNVIRGNKHGRGMTVVGGADVLYEHNLIENSGLYACMYFVQERPYGTFGVERVVAQRNTLKNCGSGSTGHGAVMIYTDGEAPNKDITLLRNDIEQPAGKNGIRVFGTPQSGIRLDSNRIVGATPAYDVTTPGVATVLYSSGAVGHTSVVPLPPVTQLPCPAQPAQESRPQACTTAGTVGSWTQTRNYAQAAAPVCWAAGAWLPATAPAGACNALPPVAVGLPVVDESSFPAPAVGGATRRIPNPGLENSFARPYRDPDGMGAFRTVCGVSHMGRYDPIVSPGLEVAGHPHTFFGNTGLRGTSTPSSVLASGNSTCRGGIVNRTPYWVPTMIDTATNRAVRPRDDNDIYYKTGYSLFGQNSQIQPFKPLFRMIAGDSKSRVAGQRGQSFECNGTQSATIPNCTSGLLVHVIAFPQCWDGVNLDSPDHRSHVVYANAGSCPLTHPVKLPEVSYHIKYDAPAGGTARWRLSSDMDGTPAGSSSHGDWMNGWEQEVMNTWVTRVINQGLSGGSHIVGDGRILD